MRNPPVYILATRNPGKVREILGILQNELPGVSVRTAIWTPSWSPPHPSPKETDPQPVLWILTLPVDAPEFPEPGRTLDENAWSKAYHGWLFVRKRYPVLGEDTGLFVDALGGEPGVRTARWGNPCWTQEQRNQALLERLKLYRNWRERRAEFRTVLVECPARRYFRGILRGWIAYSPRGTGGFGYDPIFIPECCGGCTLAELPEHVKNRVSHRAQALKQWVRTLLNSGTAV